MPTNKFFKPFSKNILWVLTAFLFFATASMAKPLTLIDSSGNQIIIGRPPARVVSLVPGITEILFEIGAGDAIVGRTYHSTWPPEVSGTTIVGGFFSPSLEKIEAARPELIFCSRLQKSIQAHFKGTSVKLVNLESDSLADTYQNIFLLGRIFRRKPQAAALVEKIEGELDLVSRKLSVIPPVKRKRVMRLMGRGMVMTPGSDSFQNELIRAAGGIAPELDKTGPVVPVTLEEWQQFNPQVVYGCGMDRATAAEFFSRPGWRDVDAVKNGQIFYFPCDLTCRAAAHAGYFVSWLAARVYADEFSKAGPRVFDDAVFASRKIDLPLDYVQNAQVADSHIHDFVNKTLIVDFKTPQAIVSTLEGYRETVETVGNHYASPQCWCVAHKTPIGKLTDDICRVTGKNREKSSFLMTGANMDHLSVKTVSFRDMQVYALVTAGVTSNALRMAEDAGGYYEPGTINILVLTNMKLSQRAMARAIITATEAKTAALTNLDIRSSKSGAVHQATGTGTDNIIVVQGEGIAIDNTGGHTKMGELIARAVHAGVTEAVFQQNGLTASRSVFHRLQERHLTVFGLLSDITCDCGIDRPALFNAVETLLLEPRYAGFVTSALALSDSYENGLIADLGAFDLWCRRMAAEIAGRDLPGIKDFFSDADLPKVQAMMLNALVNGAYYRLQPAAE